MRNACTLGSHLDVIQSLVAPRIPTETLPAGEEFDVGSRAGFETVHDDSLGRTTRTGWISPSHAVGPGHRELVVGWQ